MNEFTYLAEAYRAHRGFDDLVALAVELSETPCGPLYKRHVSPNRELDAVVRDGQRPGRATATLLPDRAVRRCDDCLFGVHIGASAVPVVVDS